jgi:hypothetical protein
MLDMFIYNEHNEVVNLDKVLYVACYCDSSPYEIHVFTGNQRVVFCYPDEATAKEGRYRMFNAMRTAAHRWIHIESPNYYIRADKVKTASRWHNGIKIDMEGAEIIIYGSATNPTESYLAHIVNELKKTVWDESAIVEVTER